MLPQENDCMVAAIWNSWFNFVISHLVMVQLINGCTYVNTSFAYANQRMVRLQIISSRANDYRSTTDEFARKHYMHLEFHWVIYVWNNLRHCAIYNMHSFGTFIWSKSWCLNIGNGMMQNETSSSSEHLDKSGICPLSSLAPKMTAKNVIRPIMRCVLIPTLVVSSYAPPSFNNYGVITYLYIETIYWNI